MIDQCLPQFLNQTHERFYQVKQDWSVGEEAGSGAMRIGHCIVDETGVGRRPLSP
jgi:hypothetical protein